MTTELQEDSQKTLEAMQGLDRIAAVREVVETCTMGFVDGVAVDLFTAQHVTQIYDALNEQNQKKFREHHIAVMVDITWKLVNGK
jgi:hypothetical protein